MQFYSIQTSFVDECSNAPTECVRHLIVPKLRKKSGNIENVEKQEILELKWKKSSVWIGILNENAFDLLSSCPD